MRDDDERTIADVSPRTFLMLRRVDETGTSGTGFVAAGVQFSDGKVVIHWLTALRSTTVFDDMETLLAIHGHNGLTVPVWLEDELTDENAQLRSELRRLTGGTLLTGGA